MTRPQHHWLVKSDPSSFSWTDLWSAPGRTTHWDGVRNFQARNMLRDDFAKGDLVFFYHSGAGEIMGVCEVARAGYPDTTAFDRKAEHYDAKSTPEAPTWFMVDLRAREAFRHPVTLEELRAMRGLEHMELLRKGSRLSVQPVRPGEWDIVYAMGMRRA